MTEMLEITKSATVFNSTASNNENSNNNNSSNNNSSNNNNNNKNKNNNKNTSSSSSANSNNNNNNNNNNNSTDNNSPKVISSNNLIIHAENSHVNKGAINIKDSINDKKHISASNVALPTCLDNVFGKNNDDDENVDYTSLSGSSPFKANNNKSTDITPYSNASVNNKNNDTVTSPGIFIKDKDQNQSINGNVSTAIFSANSNNTTLSINGTTGTANTNNSSIENLVRLRRESVAHALGMGGVSWGSLSIGSWLKDEVMFRKGSNNHHSGTTSTSVSSNEGSPINVSNISNNFNYMGQQQGTGQMHHQNNNSDNNTDSSCTSAIKNSGINTHASYLPNLEKKYCKDYSCCGLLLPSLHDLLDHYEQAHIAAASSNLVATIGTNNINNNYTLDKANRPVSLATPTASVASINNNNSDHYATMGQKTLSKNIKNKSDSTSNKAENTSNFSSRLLKAGDNTVYQHMNGKDNVNTNNIEYRINCIGTDNNLVSTTSPSNSNVTVTGMNRSPNVFNHHALSRGNSSLNDNLIDSVHTNDVFLNQTAGGNEQHRHTIDLQKSFKNYFINMGSSDQSSNSNVANMSSSLNTYNRNHHLHQNKSGNNAISNSNVGIQHKNSSINSNTNPNNNTFSASDGVSSCVVSSKSTISSSSSSIMSSNTNTPATSIDDDSIATCNSQISNSNNNIDKLPKSNMNNDYNGSNKNSEVLLDDERHSAEHHKADSAVNNNCVNNKTSISDSNNRDVINNASSHNNNGGIAGNNNSITNKEDIDEPDIDMKDLREYNEDIDHFGEKFNMLHRRPFIDDPARTLYVMDLEENKPFRCPVIGCDKSYKNQNGLKYHRLHGHQGQKLFENPDGSFSIIDPESNEPYPDGMEFEKDKPYRCEVCGRRYKNLNGLKYHRGHSTH
ncbi:zinc-coordinating transcription factor SFP1 SCDLUD_004272 [Saccharomycodes ludwigii]|uniref:zinc-coordinating transcription factor SFP1 n=1 Tax=Saccharomycodes ludwigii TaxID=36035 RepID=UPI001E855F3B|nr:hypothetical protein SCDLUD_004272 [Saccharomycodes ludwigii]KAH3899956.1 hypothetical protein SCDLUD_004272 [Saccharomycodes ludwigii]